jgi:hypothetical protein
MADDLDNRVRAAMKQLDEAVPSGYFEDLAERTLARLGGIDTSMQTEQTSSDSDQSLSPGLSTGGSTGREEDSGLHEIRALARNTRERLSASKITAAPPIDQDVLAASSAGWKAVALPEPAKVVALPDLADLPKPADVRAAKRPVQKSGRGHLGRNAVLATIGAAAAAGIVYVATTATSPSSPAPQAAVAPATPARPSGPIVEPLPAPTPAPTKPDVAPTEPTGTVTTPPVANPAPDVPTPPPVQPPIEAKLAVTPTDTAKAPIKAAPTPKAKSPVITKTGKPVPAPNPPVQTETKQVKPSDTPPAPPTKKPVGKKQSDEQSLDDLLKEDGGAPVTKQQAPKLEKKSLTTDDINNAMGGIKAKAQACFKGTQGMATVKATVAPNGKVTSVSISGAFNGKPEGNCVAALVSGLSFPPWDGGPQTVPYAYLLSD